MIVKTYGLIEKATKLQEGEVEFIVNSGGWDAYGERINIEGVDIKDFLKNPVVLWGHDGFNLPIARATKVWKENGKLMAIAKFYLKDEFPRKVYNYILDGMLSAVSIGGQVVDWAEDGLTIAKMTMKEFSVVTIPADAKALVTNKSMTANQLGEFNTLAKSYARKCLEQGSDVHKHIEVLEGLLATLKEVASVNPEGQTREDKAITRRVVLRSAQAVDSQAEIIIRSIKLKGTE